MRERSHPRGRDRTASTNRRGLLRKAGTSAVGLSLAGSGLAATGGRVVGGPGGVDTDDNTGGGGDSCDPTAINVDEQLTMRSTAENTSPSEVNYYADNNWMLGLVGISDDGDTYRFALSTIYNHHFDHEIDGLGGLGEQEKVKFDAHLERRDDTSNTFLKPFGKRITISGWDGAEWEQWYDDEVGNSYSKSEIVNELGDGDPDYDDPDYYDEWFSLISFVGGVGATAASGGAVTIGLTALSQVAGGLSLAGSVAEAVDDTQPSEDDDPLDTIYYWWPDPGTPWALTITSVEFNVVIGDESGNTDLLIRQSFDEDGTYDSYLSDADNIGHWHVYVPPDGSNPELCSKGTNYSSGGHAHF